MGNPANIQLQPKPFEGLSYTDLALLFGFLVLAGAVANWLGIWLAQKTS